MSEKKRTAQTKAAGNKKKKNLIPSAIPGLTVLNDISQKDRAKITKMTVKIILVLLAVLLLVALWRNRVTLSCANITQCAKDTPVMNGSGDGFPVAVSGGSAIQMDELAGGIAVLSDNTLTVITKNSKEAVSRAHFMSDPVMKTAGRYAMLIDAGNRAYRLETVSDTLISSSVDTMLLGCDVADNGTFALVMSGNGMLSTVEVHSRNGDIRHKWSTALYYIANAALSADGRYLAMSGINAEDGKLKSVVIIHRVGVEGEIAHFTLDNELLLDLGFSDAGTLFAVGEKSAMIITENCTECNTISLGGNTMCSDISGTTGAAVYVSTVEDNSRGRLILFDTRGNERCSVTTGIYGTAICLSESGCSLLGRGVVASYRLNGDTIGSRQTGSASCDVQLLDAKLYILEGTNVSQISVK